MYITILVKQVYWSISQVSGERLQDHWSSGPHCCQVVMHTISRMLFSCVYLMLSIKKYFYFPAGGDTANAVYRRFFSPQGGNIGITAHIGGMLAGKLLHVELFI